MRKRPSYLLFSLRALLATLLTFLMIVSFSLRQVLIRSTTRRQHVAAQWMHCWGRLLAKIFGYRIRKVNPVLPQGCLIVPNHIGYGDIVALLAAHPCVFVSKADISQWPLLGWGARLGGIIFVSRRRDRALSDVKVQVQQRLAAGQNVVIFLEGTTTDGQSVERFHSALLQAAIDVNAPVLPIAIHWTTHNPHLSISEDVAYWKDHTMGTHLVRHLGRNSKLVRLSYGTALASENCCRKSLAEQAYSQVVGLFSEPSGT
jgi:1-acyl-sn-glycerol-3-phosphate acyltransferase